MRTIDATTDKLISAAKTVQRHLGPGFTKSVYGDALAIELAHQRIDHETRFPMSIRYKGIPVGDWIVDFMIDRNLILELKVVAHLDVDQEISFVNYLTAAGIDNGILINFGAATLEVKRKFRLHRRNEPTPDSSNDLRLVYPAE